ncbi:MAG TPA: hypothetical protein VHX61_19550 [Rhizomicrobium sp.]|jgi:hypothetical protein|nr:hypothetical protein [Rhizomicrobium sp.]
MHRNRRLAGVLAALSSATFWALVSPATAGDVFHLSLDQALSMSQANARLDRTVSFYFGDAAHPDVLTHLGEYVANEKTSAVGRSDLNECAWVFQSALLRLQTRAHELGANAVIKIHSYYKKEDVSIDRDIPCHTGFLMAGIALKGEMVRLGGK